MLRRPCLVGNSPQRIWRTAPDWGGDLIDFDLFVSEIPPNAPGATGGEIPSFWFWRLLVGVYDVSLGGWLYFQVSKRLRRGSRVDRKGPMTLEMPNRIVSGQNGDGPKSIGSVVLL